MTTASLFDNLIYPVLVLPRHSGGKLKEHAMKFLSFVVATSILLTSVFALAEEPLKPQQDVEVKLAPAPKSLKIKPTRTGCYTNSSDCAGVAYFQNPTSRKVGCTIWFRTGGRSNWVYGPSETHAIHVAYGDTYSCVWAEYAPPEPSVQRNWIWVK